MKGGESGIDMDDLDSEQQDSVDNLDNFSFPNKVYLDYSN